MSSSSSRSGCRAPSTPGPVPAAWLESHAANWTHDRRDGHNGRKFAGSTCYSQVAVREPMSQTHVSAQQEAFVDHSGQRHITQVPTTMHHTFKQRDKHFAEETCGKIPGVVKSSEHRKTFRGFTAEEMIVAKGVSPLMETEKQRKRDGGGGGSRTRASSVPAIPASRVARGGAGPDRGLPAALLPSSPGGTLLPSAAAAEALQAAVADSPLALSPKQVTRRPQRAASASALGRRSRNDAEFDMTDWTQAPSPPGALANTPGGWDSGAAASRSSAGTTWPRQAAREPSNCAPASSMPVGTASYVQLRQGGNACLQTQSPQRPRSAQLYGTRAARPQSRGRVCRAA